MVFCLFLAKLIRLSHLKERTEKNCLNCNARVEGRFCHICGQENVETRESAWHLVTHFFQDITHYDGKFFSTLRLLISRPGFLSAEYIRGRRASYLNPVRMYVFTSAFFFLLFFTFINTKEKSSVAGLDWKVKDKTLSQINKLDSASFAAFTREINEEMGKGAVPMSREAFNQYYDSVVNGAINSPEWEVLNITGLKARSKEQYDSLLQSGKLRHNWLLRKINYRQLEINKRYRGRGNDILRDFADKFLHKLPQLLFVSLPLLALLLKMLYARQRRFYYADHGIFSIHLYIFIFIALLFQMFLGLLNDQLQWRFLDFLQSILVLGIFFYAYKALRNFYQQRRAKTVLKFFVLCFLFLIVMILLMFLFFILSVLTL